VKNKTKTVAAAVTTKTTTTTITTGKISDEEIKTSCRTSGSRKYNKRETVANTTP